MSAAKRLRAQARQVFKRTKLESHHFEPWFLINYQKVRPEDLADALKVRSFQKQVTTRNREKNRKKSK